MADPDVLDIAQEVAEIGNNEIAEEVSQEISATTEEVRMAAEAVLKTALMIQDHIDTEKELIKNMTAGNSLSDQNVLELSFKIQKSDITTQEQYKFLMEKIFNLQNVVNAFLGQKVRMVYLYKGRNGQFELWSLENTVDDLTITRGSKSHGGHISGRYQLSKTRLQNLPSAEQMQIEGYDPSNLNLTYAEILRRKGYSRKANPGLAPGKFVILWNEGNGWEGVTVSSEGVIAESYANFFINAIAFGTATEHDVKVFMTDDKYGALTVDNKSGFLEGDFSSANGQIQYGAKTRGATALGYQRIIQEAKNIYAECLKDTPDLKTLLENLRQTLNEEGQVHLATRLADEIEIEYSDLIKLIENATSKK